jgi:hypothetical protein
MHDVVLVKKAQALRIVAIAIRQYRVPEPVWITKEEPECVSPRAYSQNMKKEKKKAVSFFYLPRAPG